MHETMHSNAGIQQCVPEKPAAAGSQASDPPSVAVEMDLGDKLCIWRFPCYYTLM